MLASVPRFLLPTRPATAKPGPKPSPASAPPAQYSVQRRCACGGGCPRCQAAAQTPRIDHTVWSTGHPLAPPQDARLAAGFAQPVSHLRLHTDARAAAMADQLNAQAFTVGSHIFFASDRSPDDFGLLAHETAHALQQPAGEPQGAVPLGAADSAAERSADQAAVTLLAGGRAHPGATAPHQLARKERGVLDWAWNKLDDPEKFLDEVIEHPFDATVGDAGAAFVEGVKQDVGDVADLGSGALGAMRENASAIRAGGDSIEAWLVEKQKQGAAGAYADAEKYADTPVLGPLLQANAWLLDQTGQAGSGITGGAVTLGSGLLSVAADPVDAGAGVLKLAGELTNLTNPLLYASSAGTKYAMTGDSNSLNPMAEGTALGGAWDSLSKPYARAIDEGRWSEAGGRFLFDAVSLMIGSGEANAASKGTRAAPLVRTGAEVDALAKTLPAGADLAKTLPAGDDLARTLPAGDDLARTRPAGSDLADTAPGRPMPTLVLPETPAFSPVRAKQLLKLHQWLDDFFRPQQLKPSGIPPRPAALAEVEAAAQARAPVITHLSDAFHQNIWQSIGGKGEAPLAFRNNDVLYVNYERLPDGVRQAVDAGKNARSPGAW